LSVVEFEVFEAELPSGGAVLDAMAVKVHLLCSSLITWVLVGDTTVNTFIPNHV